MSNWGSRFLQRIRFKYKIFILNENTLEETFHFRLSQLSLFLFVCIFTLISFLLISVIIFATPLKHFLPGYADVSAKKDLIAETIRIDSLSRSVELQMKQINVMKHVINGTLTFDTVAGADSLTIASWADLPLERSEEESEFAKRFEEESMYNLSTINTVPAAETQHRTVFVKPADGVPQKGRGAGEGAHGVEIPVQPKSAVMAVADGRVMLYVADVAEDAGVIAVQHENGYVSLYRCHGHPLKRVNERVSAGEAIAVADAAGDTGACSVRFELWKNGMPLDPEEYIVF